jgi:uncharacterized protein YjbJ (UPF0337 family)
MPIRRTGMNTHKKDDSVREEASAFGQRVKGAVKDATGDVLDNERLEREGERENAEGRARQATNDVMDESDGVRGATVPRGGRRADGTIEEEASALGQRIKGATKDAAGAVTGDRRLEREGERENARGNERQRNNKVTG